MIYLVGARGFEPPTTCTPCKYATRLRYAPKPAIIAESLQLPKHKFMSMKPKARSVPRCSAIHRIIASRFQHLQNFADLPS